MPSNVKLAESVGFELALSRTLENKQDIRCRAMLTRLCAYCTRRIIQDHIGWLHLKTEEKCNHCNRVAAESEAMKSHPNGWLRASGYTLGYTCRASNHADRTCGSNLLSFPIRTAAMVPSRTQAQSVCRVTPRIPMTSVVLR
jgi:uncharacterized protein YfaT (DUF1175 family)